VFIAKMADDAAAKAADALRMGAILVNLWERTLVGCGLRFPSGVSFGVLPSPSVSLRMRVLPGREKLEQCPSLSPSCFFSADSA